MGSTESEGLAEGSVLLRPISAQPELDLATPADHWWMLDGSPAGIDTKRAEGYRLFRLKAASTAPLTFSALFVRNTGVYERTGGAWEFDLTADQVAERAKSTVRRIIDVCPYLVNNEPRFAIVTLDNTGRQKKTYKVLLGQTSLSTVLKEAKAFGGRITDFDKVTVLVPQPGTPVKLSLPRYSAVMIKNQLPDHREQWGGSGTLEQIGILVAQKTLQENRPVRLVALEPAVGEAFDYVMETRPATHHSWWFDGLTWSHFEDPDHLQHVTRRLRARPINVKKDAQTGRFAASLIDNGPLPLTGHSASAQFQPLDDAVMRTLKTYGIAGGALAVVRQGKLVYARGFGHSDLAQPRAATPDTLFRIASVSKPITAVAILRLIQDGAKLPGKTTKLTLDTRPFGEIFAAGQGSAAKQKLNTITVRHLLEHRSGLNSDLGSIDSLDQVLNHETPVTGTPGGPSFYLNGNYRVLGSIIEKVTGKPYQDYVREKLFQPLGLGRIAISAALPAGSPHVESRYYDCISSFNRMNDWSKPAERRSGLAADAGDWVKGPPMRYASSSWAAAVVDLLRFVCALDGSRAGTRPLDETHFQLIATGATDAATTNSYYGLGFAVGRHGDGTFDLSHGGYLPGGTNASLIRRADGISIAWMLNGDSSLPFEAAATKQNAGAFTQLIPEQLGAGSFLQGQVDQALQAVADPWPAQDLFPVYGL
jgi:CubicO group peptidase (beta-lactamase class C family)